MDAESITDYITGHIPELILLVGGMIALLIVVTYVKNKESWKYKFFVLLGFIFGALMIYLCVSSHAGWPLFGSIVIAIAGFTLVIRPFKDVPFAAIFGLLVMVIVYISLGELTGTAVEFLAEGWPRIIAALIVGAIVFGILNFIESVLKMFGKLLNWWPLLMILGLICIVEAILMFTGYGSLYDFIKDLT